MRRLLAALVVATGVAGCGGGEVLPVVGGETNLADWQGRVVVINYWAEWCAPCREEIPEFNELYWHSAADGPIVLGVNYDGFIGDDLSSVAQRMKIEFPTLITDPRDRFGYPRPEMMPTTIVLNGQQEVVETLVGPQTLDGLKAVIERY